jgi:hypothetical protein
MTSRWDQDVEEESKCEWLKHYICIMVEYKRLASDDLPHLSVLNISTENSKASIICN